MRWAWSEKPAASAASTIEWPARSKPQKDFDAITVQEILDRARVGRSTFYAHYRDKADLFLSDVEEFLDHFASYVARRKENSARVAPVKELLEHVASRERLYRALVACGRLHDLLDLAEGHFARGIEQRLMQLPRTRLLPAYERTATAHAFAGTLIALLRFWMERGMRQRPEEVDAMFHRLVWTGLGATPRPS